MKEINKDQKHRAESLREGLAEKFDEEEAKGFASKNEDKAWYDDFKLLLDMFLDDDFKVSSRTKWMIAGTLAYVILPLDVIPDFIPIAGWLDDIFVLGMTIDAISDDIEAYKVYKDAKNTLH